MRAAIRMALVTQTLAESEPPTMSKKSWNSYKLPSRKIPASATFRLRLICSWKIIGIGSARMNISPTRDKAPLTVPLTT